LWASFPNDVPLEKKMAELLRIELATKSDGIECRCTKSALQSSNAAEQSSAVRSPLQRREMPLYKVRCQHCLRRQFF
jgi:hypothetical protein